MLKRFDNKVIYLFIFLQPILDLVTSIMTRSLEVPITLGILVRSIFMVYIFIYTVFIYKPKDNLYKFLRLILIMTVGYAIIYLGYYFITKGYQFFMLETKGLLKTFYFPVVLIGLFILNKKSNINISNKTLTYILMIYTGTIFISTITGTYFRSYNDYLYGSGSIGWFFAANEIGSIVAILTPFTIINFIQNKFSLVNFISIILCVLTCLYMGTKVPFIGFIGSLFIIFIYSIIQSIHFRKKNSYINYKRSSLCIICIGLIFCTLFYKSPVYKNIEFNYGNIIKNYIDNIKNQSKNIEIEDDAQTKDRSFEESPNDEINEVKQDNPHINQDGMDALLSNRDTFEKEVRIRFFNGSVNEKLLGLGYEIVNIRDGVNTDKSIELDYQDIFYRHGFIGATLYFLPILIIIVLILKSLMHNLSKILDINFFGCIVSLILGLGIAGFAGHVITAPGVSIYIIIPIIMIYNNILYGDDKYENFNNNAKL
ncbi:O-antigen ligase family protein [Paraclostridium sordellii]|uniref:O-antigen ligase family protein n=1 Tax=Paraclostridium sordellii TaxID=1505 RepID=UPI0005DB23F5|nr:O-antigen ligase family protein [Paeniclostridium sordellii]CEQ18547.1 Uncharacterised protein [[Clostridium] sordellii] [Paeniclostridium sordellii]